MVSMVFKVREVFVVLYAWLIAQYHKNLEAIKGF